MANLLLSRLTVLGLVSLTACSSDMNVFDRQKNDLVDSEMGLSRDDYRHMSERKPGSEHEAISKEGAVKAPPIPDMSEILAAPRPPKIGETQLVSIAVTDDVPLKDVLIELARLADVDVELDAGINGGISFTAKEKPFNQVIERIADLAGLRYSMKNGVLRVERDTPYIHSYPVDFLNMNRSSQNSINISTNVLSAGGGGGGGSSSGGGSGGGGGGGGGSLNTGSSTSISSESESDFWEALETGVQVVLNYAAPNRASQVQTFIPPAPAPAAAGAAAAPGSAAGQAVAAADQANSQAAAASAAAAQAATPVAPAGGAEGVAGATGMINPNTYYILNRQGGTITVSATQKQHEMLKTFLGKMQANASAQVLIEAKIMEITLNEQYQSGVNWSAIRTDPTSTISGGFSGTFSNSTFDPQLGATLGAARTVQIFGLDMALSEAVQLAEKFGTARTISSPRLHAINNQQAALTFAENDVYFTIDIEREEEESDDGGDDSITYMINATPNTVPLGIILTFQPSINLESNEITLNVRPTLSKKLRSVPDPSVQFMSAQGGLNVESTIPVIEVRELDSILKLKSGQVMIIGGLMEQRMENEDDGVPGLAGVPWVGNLFKAVNKQTSNRELVIFIKATIVGNEGYVHDTDKIIYNKFSRDPRPVAF